MPPQEMLLEIGIQLLSIGARDELVHLLQSKLRPVAGFSQLTIGLPDDRGESWTNFIFCNNTESRGGEYFSRIATGKYPVQDGFFSATLLASGPLVWDIPSVQLWKNVPAFVTDLSTDNCSVVSVPFGRETSFSGCVFLFFRRPAEFSAGTLSCFALLARQLGACAANILVRETACSRLQDHARLIQLGRDIAGIHTREGLVGLLHDKLKKVLPFSHVLIGLIDEDKTTYSAFLLDPRSPVAVSPEYRDVTEARYPIRDGIMDHALASAGPVVYDLDLLTKKGRPPRYIRLNHAFGIRHAVFSALGDGPARTGVLVIFSGEDEAPGLGPLDVVQGISAQLSIAVSRIVAAEKIESQMQEITRYRQKLEEEKSYLQEEIQLANNYNEMVGTGPAMQKVFVLISQVGESDCSVLIMGETGTGKELVARALHNVSLRKDKVMVKVNCASIPANLIESELFGHERGSFTGAMDRRIGKFELAHNSTLFLDEIGELPLDLQAKILRALQEKEIERVGGRGVIRTDVRIIAATNRDLGKEVLAGNFRSDLYYRLNVFPLLIPPLRDRKEDIPGLAAHFLNKYSKKVNKVAMNFSHRVMKQLMAYDWPGNVRELEHLIERSVLLTMGPTINQLYLSLSTQESPTLPPPGHPVQTIDEVEREHIISILKLCDGKISGVGGAAEKLRIPPTTLTSKIIRLGIKKGFTEK